MKTPLALAVALLGLVVATRGGAWEPEPAFKKGAVVLSVEAGGGSQDNMSDGRQTGLDFWNDTSEPNRGFESPTGMVGVSVFFP